MKHWRLLILGVFFFISFLPHALDAKNREVPTLVVWNIQNNRGKIIVNLFTEDHDFPKKGVYKSISVRAQKGALYIPVDVPDGDYAIAAFHDEDSNGKISIGFFGPTEGYGFGNDAKGTFGPPDFKNAVVRLKKSARTKMKIVY